MELLQSDVVDDVELSSEVVVEPPVVVVAVVVVVVVAVTSVVNVVAIDANVVGSSCAT